jgi:hypothetical protein
MPIPNSFAAGSARAFGFLGNVSPSDPYFNYVTMLLPGNGTNGAQNNTFLDSSTNNFTITRIGNTTQGTFSPYGNNWSNFFDGTGDYLSGIGTTSSFNFMHNSTALFTAECWVYVNRLSSPITLFDNNSSTSSETGVTTQIYTNGTVNLFITYGSTGNNIANITTTGTVPTNQWTHIAFVYDQSPSSGNGQIYINGVLAGSGNKSGNTPSSGNASNAMRIGCYGNGAAQFMNGYISNLRIVNAKVYTAAFTPPTAPLTAITNTSLLTCQSNRFIDNSTNNFTITRNGDVSVQRFSPFSPTASYAPSVDGGSGYFDGISDYLSIPDNDSWVLGNNFTIECWLYFTTTSGIQQFINQRASSASCWQFLYNFPNSGDLTFKFEDGNVAINRTWSPTVGQWYHIAVTRSSNTWYLFVNGTQLGSTATNSTSFPNIPATIWVGTLQNPTGESFNGYMTDLRVVKSSVYTANFTPPTVPLTAITNTQLLANFTNAGIIDNAEMNDLETVGNAQISTVQSKFGGGSIFLDGTGDGVYAPSSQNFALPGDFTIEFWLYQTATSGEGTAVYNPTTNGFNIFMSISGNWGIARSNVAIDNNFGTTPSFNTWNHIAISRSTGTIRAFVNGNQVFSGTNTTSYVAGPLQIGISGFGSITGYIDDLRITKGYARYIANFTPPSQPLPTK